MVHISVDEMEMEMELSVLGWWAIYPRMVKFVQSFDFCILFHLQQSHDEDEDEDGDGYF